MLLLACATMFGSSTGYDSPSAVSIPLKEYLGLGFEEFQYQFNMLYSVYSLPNVILPIYSGRVINRLGLGWAMVVMSSWVFAGVFFFAVGVSAKSFPIMLAARLSLGTLRLHSTDAYLTNNVGIGSETLAILQSSLVTRYFLGSDLSFALAMTLTAGRLNSVLNYNVIPRMARSMGVPDTFWMCVFIACVSAVAIGVILFVLWLERGQEPGGALRRQDSEIALNRSAAEHERHRSSVMDDDRVSILPPASNIGEEDLQTPRTRRVARVFDQVPSKFVGLARGFLRLILPADALEFPLSFWIVTATLICYSTATITFLPMAAPYLETKYFPGDVTKASSLVSVPDSLSVILMPFIALIADKQSSGPPTKHPQHQLTNPLPKMNQLVISGMCLTLAHFSFAVSMFPPLSTLLLLGFGYAMFGSVVYSLMAELVNNNVKKKATRQGPYQRITAETMKSTEIPSSPISPTADSDSKQVDDDGKSSLLKVDTVRKVEPPSNEDGEESAVIATAYGVSGCLVNGTFFLTPIFVAWLITGGSASDISENVGGAGAYKPMEAFYVFVSLFGTILAVLVRMYEAKQTS